MNRIIILGAGFAGVAAARQFKKRNPKDTTVTIIDQNPFHTFTPSLYEVATREEPQKNIAIPLSKTVDRSIEIKRAKVTNISEENSNVILENGERIAFDYLLIALGSEPAYFGVDGLDKFSLVLKSATDAIKIKNAILKAFKNSEERHKKLNIVVGGGGFSGTELAAELINFQERLQKKVTAAEFMEISVVEGTDRLLNGLSPKASAIAQKRLEGAGVKILTNSFIEKVEKDKIKIKDGPEINYDVLIWTGGVAASSILKASGFETIRGGQVEVDEQLRVKGSQNIFAAGDVACILDPKTQKAAPGVAQIAEDEGKIAAENILRSIENKKLTSYFPKHLGYIIPLNGRFAYASVFNFEFSGILGWFLQQFVYLRYLLGILPISLAFSKWNKFEEDLKQA